MPSADIEVLNRQIEELRREIKAGAAGRTTVTRDWLRWARVELRRLMKRGRALVASPEHVAETVRGMGATVVQIDPDTKKVKP